MNSPPTPLKVCALVSLTVVIPLAVGRGEARAGVAKAKETHVVACGESEDDAGNPRRGHHALAAYSVEREHTAHQLWIEPPCGRRARSAVAGAVDLQLADAQPPSDGRKRAVSSCEIVNAVSGWWRCESSVLIEQP